MAVLIFLIVDLLIGIKYKFLDIGLSFIAWQSIGNSNWYIFAVLCLYIITYVSSIISKQNNFIFISAILTGCLLYSLLMFIGKKNSIYYNTIFCYPAGMILAINKDKLDSLLSKSILRVINFCIVTVLLLLCFVLSIKLNNLLLCVIFYELSSILFVLDIVIVSSVIQFSNPIIDWLGKYVFEIYILQRIPMIIFDGIVCNTYIYFILSLAITIFLSIVFKILLDKICNSKIMNKNIEKLGQSK